MKILITGATGLIGKKLTADLLSKGYSVNYLTTRKSKIKSSKQINGYYWDPEKDIIDSLKKAYIRDKKIEHLSAIICLERKKTTDDILIPVSGGKNAGDTSNNQYQIDSDKNPICAL